MYTRILACLFCSISLYSTVNDNGDFQIWQRDTCNIALSKKMQLKFETEFRFGNDAQELFFKYGQAGLVYKHRLWLKVSPAFRFIARRSDSDAGWVAICDPMLDIETTNKVGKGEFKWRNRLEYFILSGQENAFLYRMRVRYNFPKAHYVVPFIDEELFFFEGQGYNQNRLTLGLSWKVGNRLSLSPSYMLRHDDFTDMWRYQNVLNLHFHMRF